MGVDDMYWAVPVLAAYCLISCLILWINPKRRTFQGGSRRYALACLVDVSHGLVTLSVMCWLVLAKPELPYDLSIGWAMFVLLTAAIAMRMILKALPFTGPLLRDFDNASKVARTKKLTTRIET